MLNRRAMLLGTAGLATTFVHPSHCCFCWPRESATTGLNFPEPDDGEDLIKFVRRIKGKFDVLFYQQLLGAANEYKEGDAAIGVAAADNAKRSRARLLLANTRLVDVDRHAFHRDQLYDFITAPHLNRLPRHSSEMTVGQLKQALLTQSTDEIRAFMPELSSDTIGCVVKLMTNDELIVTSKKVFNPLPGTKIGAPGYLSARIQPNSPTDNVDDIRWQVFDGWAYAVGDALLGTNPVAITVNSVTSVELALRELLEVFQLQDILPHCVLAHIDVQAEVEQQYPGTTALWFQSIAGCDSANQTFDITIDKMVRYAQQRTGKYGLYFETGQGADFTNGHGHGFDMVLHESRKYGLARALSHIVAETRGVESAWVHVNDVAGFIGPEVFRTREQLVRCCLEDIVMGKLHGLCIGLDVCSTLHMDVSLSDLDWCLDHIMPANPAYLMALPTKIDPMLGYLTTGYQDHVRLRRQFNYRVNDAMWGFFQRLGVIDATGQPTQHFGDPTWVYAQYQRAKGDARKIDALQHEGLQLMEQVRSRGVFLASGYGETPSDLAPQLRLDIERIYADSKKAIWAELTPEFIATIPHNVSLATLSRDRQDYILHPSTGEQLSTASIDTLRQLRVSQKLAYDLQIVISDGLNSLAIEEPDQLLPFLAELRTELEKTDYRVAPSHLVVRAGRVRAGYQIGEVLYGGTTGRGTIVHIIGERPGTGHHTFSVYFTTADAQTWSEPKKVDHDITRVVSGIATTALLPKQAAKAVVQQLLDR